MLLLPCLSCQPSRTLPFREWPSSLLRFLEKLFGVYDPLSHAEVQPPGQEVTIVRSEGQAPTYIPVDHEAFALQVPQPDRAVPGVGRDPLAIGSDGYRHDRPFVILELGNLLALEVPEVRVLGEIAPREEEIAVGREGNLLDATGVHHFLEPVSVRVPEG